jgi:predicted ferric reductase
MGVDGLGGTRMTAGAEESAGALTRLERGSIAIERRMRRWGGGPGLLGYAVVVTVVGVALLLYFLDAHTNHANGGAIGARGTWFVVGEATGIGAAVLLAFTVILASRLSILELLFGDLTKVYVAHGIIGLAMFALVSFHPMMYLLGGLVLGGGFLKAAHVLVPFHVVVLDWISYIAITVALIPTMFMRLSFEWWRAVHLLLGAAMILTGYSILIDNVGFDTSAIPALRDYLYVLFGLGTAAFVWVALIRRLAEPKREYEITGAEYHAAANAIELTAKPVGKRARFRAGQFTYVDLMDSMAQIRREFEAHPFSIASPPGRDEISLVIQGAGDHTRRIQQIAAADGARALLHGAFGRLSIVRPVRQKQLWLAGGIGITPFMSMAQEMADHPERYGDYDVDLVIGVSHAEQAFKHDQLLECARCHPGLRVHLWDRELHGYQTVEALTELIGDLRERAVMISGSEAMISNLTSQLLAAGVTRGQIRSERAIGPPGRWRVASPGLRYARAAVTSFFGVFVLAVVVSTVARAIGG